MKHLNYQAFWVFNFRDFEGVDARLEIERQLAGFADRGMTRVVLHLRFGHTIPYLSEKWATLLGYIFSYAQRRGLSIILWEDDAWPPGFVGGRLTHERPELRGHNLHLNRRAAPEGQPVSWELGSLPVLAARAVAEDGRAVDLLAHVGTHATEWSVFQARHLYVGGDKQADQVVYSRANQGDVRYFLDWTPPRGGGAWTVYWLERLEPAFKYSGYLLDSLSAEATQARIHYNYQWYHDRFAPLFGSTIGGFYCAEPPQNNWTHDLFARFQARYGYALEERFFQLGYGQDDRAAQVRMDFKRLVADLFAEHYVAPVTRWCEERGVQFWARLEGDESIEVQSELRGGIYPAVKLFSVPVFDLVNGSQFGDPTHARLNTGINFCNSIARQQGAPTLFEGVGPVGWGMKLSDPEAQYNWAIALGCDSLQSENFFYSIDGYRKDDCPPSQSYQNPYWKVFGAWRDQYVRLADALAGAKPEAVETALIMPIHSMNAVCPACLTGDAPPKDERIKQVEESFQTLHQQLLEAHVPVDIVDERALEEAKVEAGRLVVGRQCYQTLILPCAPYLSPAARANLDAFVKSGGTLREDAVPDSSHLPAGCYARFYREGATRLVLLFNHTSRPIEAETLASRYTRVPVETGGSMGGTASTPPRGRAVRNSATAADRTAADSVPPGGSALPPGSLSLWREGAGLVLENGPTSRAELPASGWQVEMPRNAVVLDEWNFKVVRSGKMDMEQPTPAAFGIASCRPAPLFQQVELRGHDHRRYGPGYSQAPDGYKPIVGSSPFPLHVAYRCHFIPEQAVLDSLQLIMETEAVQGGWRMFVNGRLVPRDAFVSDPVYDVGNRRLELASYLKPGVANWIEIQVQADRPEQGLLEPLRILGDFALDRHPNGPRLLERQAPAGLGDWAGYGYPETAGWATYRTTFSTDGSVCELDLGVVYEVASVFVDEREVGHLFKPPYRIRLTDLAPGPHRLRVEVANGLGNLLQQLRNPAGLYGPVIMHR